MQPTGPAPTTANRVGLNEDVGVMAASSLVFFNHPSLVVDPQGFNGSAVKLIFMLFQPLNREL
jgi:hypothetical protein